MKIVTRDEIINIDRRTTEKIPSILLMEHVASDIFYLLVKRHKKNLYNNVVHIFASVGGNGGDGLALTRYLIKNGYDVKVYITGNLDRVNKDTYSNFSILKSMYVDIVYLSDENRVLEAIASIEDDDIVIDSLFGVGGIRALSGIEKLLIDSVNELNVIRIAIDLPSGILSKIEDYSNENTCFRATETYTICFAKDILFLYRTREYVGELFVIKSIFPDSVLEEASYKAQLIDYNEKINIIKNPFFSKREQGKLAIIAGSSEFLGASILATMAAYRSGVGYIRLYVPKGIVSDIRTSIMTTMPEIVIIGVGNDGQKYFTENDIHIYNDINKSDACLLGSGIGRELSTEVFVNAILKQIKVPTVVDADALYMMLPTTLDDLSDNFILTPHIYEFEKFMNIDSIEVLSNPYIALSRFREYTKANIILKDAISFIMNNNDIYVNYNPTNGMGKAGMGDVLAGLIASYLSRKLSSLDACKLALIKQHNAFRKLLKSCSSDYIQPSDLVDIL